MRIRGAEGEQTLVVIDGVRVGDPSSPGGGFDFANLMLGAIDRIEVLRGANGLPWGGQAISRVVASTARPTQSAAARAAGSAPNMARAIQREVNGRSPTSARVAMASAAAMSAPTASAMPRSAPNATATANMPLNLTNRTEIGNTLTVHLRAFSLYADNRVDLDGFAPPTYSFGDTAEYQGAARTLCRRLPSEHRPGGNAGTTGFSHKLAFGFADINRDNYDPAVGSDPSFKARGRSERLSYSIDWLTAGNASGQQVRLIAGAELDGRAR